MTSVNLLPLLERLAGEPDELLRRSLLTAVTAMAQSGASEEHMPTNVREAWAEKVSFTPRVQAPLNVQLLNMDFLRAVLQMDRVGPSRYPKTGGGQVPQLFPRHVIGSVSIRKLEHTCMQILGWLCDDSCSAMLRFACADALTALASDSTEVGLGIARAWLGDLLVHLSRNVKAHHSIRQVHMQQACTH